MPNPLVSAVGSAVGGAIQSRAQSKAAGKAADAQGAAADASIAESRRQFDTVKTLLQPYVSAGGTALDGMMALLGCGGTDATTTGAAPLPIETIGGGETCQVPVGRMSRDQDMQPTLQSNPISGYKVGGQTFKTLAEAQQYAQANGTGGTVTPGMSADQAQQAAIEKIKNGSQFNELAAQGEYGILANAAATGGLRGGDTQGALAQFRPAMLQRLIEQQLQALGGIAANGQSAAGGLRTAAQNPGGQVISALGDKGAAQAGASIATGRATSGFLTGLGSTAGDLAGAWAQRPAGAGLWQSWGF